MVESNHEILEIHEWDLAGASGNSPFPHQHKQKNRKIVSVWSGSASAQLKTVIPALSACIYTAKRRWLSGHHPLAVRGPRVPTQFHFRPRGWGTIQLPGLSQGVGGSPPPPHPAFSSRAVNLPNPKPYHLSVLHPCYRTRLKWIGPLREFLQNQWLMVSSKSSMNFGMGAMKKRYDIATVRRNQR